MRIPRLVGSVQKIAGAMVAIEQYAVISTYEDGAQARFFPPHEDEQFAEIAKSFGYTDALQYGLEHDVTHHLIAQHMGWPHSKVIFCEAHGRNWTLYSKDDRWHEEHLVNRMLTFINTGRVDEDYGCLVGSFGDRLCDVARHCLSILRPWIA